MNRILKKVVAGGIVWLARNYEKVSLDLAKIEAATAYVKTVKNVRALAMGVIGLLVVVVLMVAGLFGASLALVWILPISAFAKALSFLIFSAVVFAATLSVLLVVVSEKQWMKRSKADRFVRDAALRVLHRKHA